MAEDKDVNLIAIKSLIDCIDNRDIAEGGIFLDDDNAEFVADILRYHYKSLTTRNKMEAVAAMFGKKLGEEFTVRGGSGEYKTYFAKDGFMIKVDNDLWYASSSLVELLTGEAVIVDD